MLVKGHCNLQGGCGAKSMARSKSFRVRRYNRRCCLGQLSRWFQKLNRTHCAIAVFFAQKARAKSLQQSLATVTKCEFF